MPTNTFDDVVPSPFVGLPHLLHFLWLEGIGCFMPFRPDNISFVTDVVTILFLFGIA